MYLQRLNFIKINILNVRILILKQFVALLQLFKQFFIKYEELL